MTRAVDICWLPALPREGSVSMDRYWHEMERCAAAAGVATRAPMWLGRPPAKSQRRSGPVLTAQKWLGYPAACFLEKADLFHVLDHSFAHLLPSLSKKGVPTVATAFDLVPLEIPETMRPSQVKRFRWALGQLRLATHVISISHLTKEKLVSMLGIPAENISVAPPGADLARFSQTLAADHPLAKRLAGLPRIIFSVGTATPRKNLGSLPAIFAEMKSDFAKGRCVFVRGGSPLPEEVRAELIQVTGERGLLELGPLFGDDLVAAFQAARVLIFPSTLEGLTFVIPEAQAAGCAVVTNTLTANPEAGGDAALYYTEGESAAAAAHLRTALFDDAAHVHLREKGLARARQMTWERHFDHVLEVYRRLLPEKLNA